MSLMRYEGGTATYLSVPDSQGSLFTAELTLAQATQQRILKPDSAVQGSRRRMEITRASRRRGSSAQFIWTALLSTS
jgi:hypothetical protein